MTRRLGSTRFSKTASVSHRKDGHYERIIEIACEVPEAQMLLAIARRLYPDAVSAIEKSYRHLESCDSD